MIQNKETGWWRIVSAAVFSWQGLQHTFENEEAFRLVYVLTCLLIPLAIWPGQSGMERALLLVVVILVLMGELLYAGIEAVMDRPG